MTCPTHQITLENCTMTFYLFLRTILRHQHCAKHFLNLEESWHALENVAASAHDILTWRQEIVRLKCKGEYHSERVCLNYIQCENLLAVHSIMYCDKIASVLLEMEETGAAAIYNNDQKCLCLSSDGLIVIASILPGRNRRYWNVVTTYVRCEKRIREFDEATYYERFFSALDKARLILKGSGGRYRYVKPDIWKSYENLLLTYGESNERV